MGTPHSRPPCTCCARLCSAQRAPGVWAWLEGPCGQAADRPLAALCGRSAGGAGGGGPAAAWPTFPWVSGPSRASWGALCVTSGSEPSPSCVVHGPPRSLYKGLCVMVFFSAQRFLFFSKASLSSFLHLGFVPCKKTFHHFETILKIVLFGEGTKKYTLVPRPQPRGVGRGSGVVWVGAPGHPDGKIILEEKCFEGKKLFCFSF